MEKFLININGELFNETTAKISIFDRGFLYGESVYEATRTFDGFPFRLASHLERLFESAQKIGLEMTLSSAEITEVIAQTIKASPQKDLSLRIILTRGTNSDLGLNPSLAQKNNLIVIAKPIASNPDWWLTKGLSMVFYHKKSSPKGALPKTGNYIENIAAHSFALSQGAYDAIMINDLGHATEGTTSNIWLIRDKIIYTPSLSDGVLEGLTRKTLFQMAKQSDLLLKEASLTPEDFLNADECFLTSTTRNIVPITSIDKKLIGDGLPGALTLKLLKMYLNFVQS